MKIEEVSRQEIIDEYLDRYMEGEPIPTEIQIMIQEFLTDDVAVNPTSGTKDFN